MWIMQLLHVNQNHDDDDDYDLCICKPISTCVCLNKCDNPSVHINFGLGTDVNHATAACESKP